jgi:hypothetical protein
MQGVQRAEAATETAASDRRWQTADASPASQQGGDCQAGGSLVGATTSDCDVLAERSCDGCRPST